MIVHAIGENHDGFPALNTIERRKRQVNRVVKLSALPGTRAVDRRP